MLLPGCRRSTMKQSVDRVFLKDTVFHTPRGDLFLKIPPVSIFFLEVEVLVEEDVDFPQFGISVLGSSS